MSNTNDSERRFQDVRHLREWFMEHPDNGAIASDANLRRTLLYAFRLHGEHQMLDFDPMDDKIAMIKLESMARVRRIRQGVEGLCQQAWFRQMSDAKIGIVAKPVSKDEPCQTGFHWVPSGPMPIFPPVPSSGLPVVFIPKHLIEGMFAFLQQQRGRWIGVNPGTRPGLVS